ncbi:MAG TPA: ABC transporter permease, partial [bacterium]|nr:ABC transporter permease [bacterium]
MMTFWWFAWKNLTRQPIRTGLTIGGVALTMAVLVSLLGFNVGYRKALKRDMENMGYQVLVTAKGCPYEAATLLMKGGNIPYYITGDVLTEINARGGQYMASQTPLFMQAGFNSDGTMQLYLGIDNTFMKLKPWLKFHGGAWYSGPEANEVILGYEAAELESRRPGDEMYLEPLDKTFRVAGIFARTGTEDDGTIFFPLATAQRLFNRPGELTGIGVVLKDLNQMADFVDAVYDIPNTQVVTMAQVEGTITTLVNTAQVLIYAVAAVAILVALL